MSIRMWRRNHAPVLLLGKQPYLIHTRRPYIIHHLHNHAILGMSIGFHEHMLVEPSVQLVLHFGRKLINRNAVITQINSSVTAHTHDDGIVLTGIGHSNGIIALCHVHRHAGWLEHWDYHHKNDEQHQHNVYHRGHVNLRGDLAAFVSVWARHSYLDTTT